MSKLLSLAKVSENYVLQRINQHTKFPLERNVSNISKCPPGADTVAALSIPSK